MNDEKISFNLTKLFPEAVRRVKILEHLQKTWAGVVGLADANHSWPYNLGINEISVAADSKTAVSRIRNMKGTILRALENRYGYESKGEFILKVTEGEPREKIKATPQKIRRIKNVTVDENHVKELMSDAPEDLPEDINYAISHLQAVMEKLI